MVRIAGLIFLLQACSSLEKKPKLELLLAQTTLLVARDLRAMEYAKIEYSQAERYFIRAREAYRLKEFEKAKILSLKALSFAEKAEFKALKKSMENNE